MPLPIEGLFEGNGNQEDTKFVRVEHRNRKIHPNVNSGNILNLAPYNLNTTHHTKYLDRFYRLRHASWYIHIHEQRIILKR